MERIDGLSFGNIRFAYPRKTKAVSVTGAACDLNCAHCGGHYLQHMQDIKDISPNDASSSWLVSGGCRRDGRVPIKDYIHTLACMKQARRYNLHVGLVDEEEIDGLAKIADCVSFDFVGDDATIQTVFGNGRRLEEYIDCYVALQRKVRVVPHICIGLKGGEISGEYRALALLKELGAAALTFIIFRPTPGTRFAQKKPPALIETAKVLTQGRLLFPDIPVHLGCMRPGGRYRGEIDQWAVRIGLNSIVNPAPAAVTLAEKLGLNIQRGEECCVL